MKESRPLSDLYSLYRQNRLDRAAFEGAVFAHVRDNPQRFRLAGWSEDDRLDLLCWMYPRLRRAVDAYKETGSGFDAYIHSLLRWAALEYRAAEAERTAMELACWQDRANDIAAEAAAADPAFQVLAAAEPDESYAAAQEGKRPAPRDAKPILIIALKNCFFMNDALAAKVAKAVGMEEAELQAAIGALRANAARRWTDLKELEERVAAQYYRCVAFAAREAACPEGSVRRENLRGLSVRARRRYESMRQRLARTTRDVSNREVAEYLRIPKGTVDSCLAVLKHRAGLLPRRSS